MNKIFTCDARPGPRHAGPAIASRPETTPGRWGRRPVFSRAAAFRLAVCAIIVLWPGCSFREWGRDLGGGLAEGAATAADSVGGSLVAGIADTLRSVEVREKLRVAIDDVGMALSRQAAVTRDTLLGEYTKLWIMQLRHDLLGEGTREDVAALRDELLGGRTKLLLGQMRDEVLGEASKQWISDVRNDLLGASTRAAIGSIVDTAMSGLILRYRQDLRPELDIQRSFFQRNATWFLVLAAGLSIAVIAFVWWQKARYRKLIALLAFQIHEIPDQPAYDRLTRGVQQKAKEAGSEPLLRELLAQQGLLGEAAWHPPARQ